MNDTVTRIDLVKLKFVFPQHTESYGRSAVGEFPPPNLSVAVQTPGCSSTSG